MDRNVKSGPGVNGVRLFVTPGMSLGGPMGVGVIAGPNATRNGAEVILGGFLGHDPF